MRSIFFFLIFFLELTFISSSEAQFRISGKLVNETGVPIAFANVMLQNPKDSLMVTGAISDEKGTFLMANIPKGDYLLTLKMIGYKTKQQQIQLAENLEIPPIVLTENTENLDEVVVSASRPAIEMSGATMVVNVANSPVLQNGNLFQMMSRLPGISFGQNNSLQYKGSASVMVIINGKQTYLSQEQLADLMENTPAQNVEKIELMDNPPAKYDAAGTAGMINIVLKKPEDLGTNGSVSLNIGQGRYEKINPSLILNHRTEKLNIFGSYTLNYNKSFRELDINRNLDNLDIETGQVMDGQTTIDQFFNLIFPRKSHIYSLGTDWFIGNKTTLGIFMQGTQIGYLGRDHALTHLSGDFQNPFAQTETFTNHSKRNQNLNFNLNFKHEFKHGGLLNLDLDQGKWNNKLNSDINTIYFDTNGNFIDESLTLNNSLADIGIRAYQLDYSQKAGNFNLETGLKVSKVKSDNDFKLSIFDDESSFVVGEDVEDRFIYDEQISAGYFSLSRKWSNSWQLQAGLRAEHTRSIANSVARDSIVDRDYLNFFPNLSLGRNLGKNQGINFSYSRRINRPNYQDLNPFERISDPFTFIRGNPFLNPELAHVININYRLKNRYFWITNYQHTTDAIQFIMEQDPGRQPFFLTRRNFAKIENINTTLVGLIDIADWWTANITITGILIRTQSPFLENSIIDITMPSFQGKIQNTITLPKGINMELSSQYRSRLGAAGWLVGSQYRTDIGLSKKWGKTNLTMSLDDVFNTWNWTWDFNTGPIDTHIWDNYESRVLRLNVSYRFGNEKVKEARKRKTAASEIQERAKEN